MTPKRAAAYAAAVVPLLAPLCSGVAIKVDIAFNPPEERASVPIFQALPEAVQSILANDIEADEGWQP